ncbi:membrane protein [Candidatus Methylomirabilis lanthanidiphila]|uniref:Membrane protein n=1 Tax=Candidatus Methylomirabilis lanthanidiphila TaxID=2211376 RepID=A0A564ZGP8_9BACT|nr:DUF542 domain-containing protein [Candidatus Methylomirabilis lanthanidiphila]VUZ84521.1 membrane protein [Candidatus Methylomirabilis lanthanidiphila]
MAAHQFTSVTTVDDVVHTDPALSRVLNAHGIDTCCGGSATLAEAAHVRGIDLDKLLTALNQNGKPRTQPATVAAEPVRPCASPACEVSTPLAQPPRAAVVVPAVPRPTRYVRFFAASLLFALTFGSTLGALTLATLTLPWNFLGGLSTDSARLAHGYTQVFGFAALFIMGVAYHVIPRFKAAPLAAPGAASASFWLQTGGVLVVAIGVLVGPPMVGPTQFVGASTLLAAALAFGWVIHRSLDAGAPTPERFERYLRAGCGWLVVAAALAVVTAAGVDPLQPAVWEAALWGFAGSWILGMGLRIIPVFLGLSLPSPRTNTVLFAGYQLAALAWILVAVIETWVPLPGLRALSGITLSLTVGMFVLQLGILGPWENQTTVGDRGYEKFLIAAYAWLLVASAFMPMWSAVSALAGDPMPALVLDFGRHAFTLGFLTQIIVGVAARLIPVFAGTPLWSTGWRDTTFYLLNAAIATRGLELLVEVAGLAGVWPYISVSGVFGVGAFAAFAVNVIMTVRAYPTATTLASTAREPMADNFVADLLIIPGALELLVSRGLRPLQNPEMRAAMAPTVTLRQACRIHSIELEPLLAELGKLAAISRQA